MSVLTSSLSHIPLADVPAEMINGARCLAGYNSIAVASDLWRVDDCASAPVFVGLYIVFNLGYNLLVVVVFCMFGFSLVHC